MPALAVRNLAKVYRTPDKKDLRAIGNLEADLVLSQALLDFGQL